MKKILLFFLLVCIIGYFTKSAVSVIIHHPPQMAASYDLLFESEQIIKSAAGTKSVVFNSTGKKLYALNLEGLSVCEFDQSTKTLIRQFKFKASVGNGWDYISKKPIISYKEKPVEACFTNQDKVLWVSLHNNGGIIPLVLNAAPADTAHLDSTIKKLVVVMRDGTKYPITAPLIATGNTPKVIAKTGDDKYILVSNWHSKTVSVIETNSIQFPYGKLIKNIDVVAIPRGLAVDDANKKTYIAIMGGNSIGIINNRNWKLEKYIPTTSNPRHILLHKQGRLLVSYNIKNQIACIDANTGATLFSTQTHLQPRTIAMSKNQEYLFVTCYTGNMVDVYKINENSFELLYTIPCKGKPVGVDIYEDASTLEAWVCSYVGGTIKVLKFKKG